MMRSESSRFALLLFLSNKVADLMEQLVKAVEIRWLYAAQRAALRVRRRQRASWHPATLGHALDRLPGSLDAAVAAQARAAAQLAAASERSRPSGDNGGGGVAGGSGGGGTSVGGLSVGGRSFEAATSIEAAVALVVEAADKDRLVGCPPFISLFTMNPPLRLTWPLQNLCVK